VQGPPSPRDSTQASSPTNLAPTSLSSRVRLPRLSSLFPSLPSLPSGESSGDSYLKPQSGLHFSSSRPLENYIVTNLDAIRRGFEFHRQCNRHIFVCFDEARANDLLDQLQRSLACSHSLTSETLCQIFSIAAISAQFNRVEIPSEYGDLLYQAATDRLGDWVHDEPLTGMRCCGMLGLLDLFQKAAISVLYLGKAARLFFAHDVC